MTTRRRIKLRDYQQLNVKQIRKCFAGGSRRVLFQSPTGSGKTVLFAHIVARAAALGNHVIILGHRQEIIDQISEALTDLGVEHGMIAAGYPENPELIVQVASVATFVRRIDRLCTEVKLLIIDEAHHAVAATWCEILTTMMDAQVLGVTATPLRLDGIGLDNIFDTLVIGPSTAELIEAGHLSKFVTYAPGTLPDLSEVHSRMGDYVVNELAVVMSRELVVQPAVDDYTRLCPGVPAIVFCVDVAHSQSVAGRFIAAGYKTAHVDGKTNKKKRRELIAALGTGELQVLCNCGIVSEGLDVPGVVAVILLRPTQSLALYLQMVGRALRPAPGKARALILDHSGNTYRFDLADAPRYWLLEGEGRGLQYSGPRVHRCKACGALNPINAKTCSECGSTELHSPIAPVVATQPTRYGRDPCGSYGDDPCTSKGKNRRCLHCNELALPWPFQNPANPEGAPVMAHGRINTDLMWDLTCEGCFYKDLTPEEKAHRDKTAVRIGTSK